MWRPTTSSPTAVTSGPLTAPASGNGVYRYGGTATAGIFPNSTFSAANYWADVVFTPAVEPTRRRRRLPTRATATEKGGVANGSGGSAASRQRARPTTPIPTPATPRPSPRSASARPTARSARRWPAPMAASCSMPRAPSPTPSTRAMPPCRRLRQSTNTLTEVFSYTMRDTAGATATATLTVTIHGANDAPVLAVQTGEPERRRRLGLLAVAAGRHLHRCRCRRHARPTRQPPPTARRCPPG